MQDGRKQELVRWLDEMEKQMLKRQEEELHFRGSPNFVCVMMQMEEILIKGKEFIQYAAVRPSSTSVWAEEDKLGQDRSSE